MTEIHFFFVQRLIWFNFWISDLKKISPPLSCIDSSLEAVNSRTSEIFQSWHEIKFFLSVKIHSCLVQQISWVSNFKESCFELIWSELRFSIFKLFIDIYRHVINVDIISYITNLTFVHNQAAQISEQIISINRLTWLKLLKKSTEMTKGYVPVSPYVCVTNWKNFVVRVKYTGVLLKYTAVGGLGHGSL